MVGFNLLPEIRYIIFSHGGVYVSRDSIDDIWHIHLMMRESKRSVTILVDSTRRPEHILKRIEEQMMVEQLFS